MNKQKPVQQRVINSQIKQKRGGCKCCSPVLLHGKITRCRAGQPRNIIMWIKDRENLRKGNENNEQFSNTEIQRRVSLSAKTR